MCGGRFPVFLLLPLIWPDPYSEVWDPLQPFGLGLDSLKRALDPGRMSSLSKSCASVHSTNTEQLTHGGPVEALVGTHIRLFIFNIFP